MRWTENPENVVQVHGVPQTNAAVDQLADHDPSKFGVASSSLVCRSTRQDSINGNASASKMWGVVTHHRSENGAGIILKSWVLVRFSWSFADHPMKYALVLMEIQGFDSLACFKMESYPSG